jgi:hypothetical protein
MHSINTFTDRQIKQRAFELWEQRGCPEGYDAEFRAQAERELTLGENPSATTANTTSARSGSGSDGPSES